jgi:hypothetical protein
MHTPNDCDSQALTNSAPAGFRAAATRTPIHNEREQRPRDGRGTDVPRRPERDASPRTPYRIEDGGRTPFGSSRRSAAELAECIRFALLALDSR